MTRILYLTSADYAALTGGHVYNSNLLAALAKQGQTPRILKLDTAFPDIPSDERDIARDVLLNLPKGSMALMDHVYLCRLQSMMQQVRQPVAVIFHHSDVMEHGTDADEEGQRLFHVEKSALQLATKVIVSSGETARYLSRYGIKEDRILVAAPGNPPALKGTAGRSENSMIRILSVGALIPRKRYEHILQVASMLGDCDWQWTIVGDPHRNPGYTQDLNLQCRALGLEGRLLFAGDVPNGELRQLRMNTDLCVAASFYEGYGMAIAEALRHGIPVVTTSSGAVSTWVGAGVLQVDAETPHAMAQAINSLANNRAELIKLAEEAWQFGQSLLSWDDTFAGVADWLLTEA